MGLFDRMKRSVKSKANSAIDKMTDPEKELDMAIMELEEIRKKAIEELIAYKAAAKQMKHDIEREEKRSAEWEQRAMAAVKAGDDELAKKALRECQDSKRELAKIKRDRDEAASYAIQLNNSRKTADHKLRMLKLKKGTMATQIKAARTGNALGVDNGVFERFAEAEQAIDEEAIEAEVFAAMSGEEQMDKLSGSEFDRKLLEAGADSTDVALAGAEDPLEALKAKMAAEKKAKKLPK